MRAARPGFCLTWSGLVFKRCNGTQSNYLAFWQEGERGYEKRHVSMKPEAITRSYVQNVQRLVFKTARQPNFDTSRGTRRTTIPQEKGVQRIKIVPCRVLVLAGPQQTPPPCL